MKGQDPKTNEFANRCNLYLGGKNGDKDLLWKTSNL